MPQKSTLILFSLDNMFNTGNFVYYDLWLQAIKYIVINDRYPIHVNCSTLSTGLLLFKSLLPTALLQNMFVVLIDKQFWLGLQKSSNILIAAWHGD